MTTMNMNATDYGLTTDGIFLRAPRLTTDDIGESLTDSDVDLIEDFEDAWEKFLSSRPGTLPPGRKIKNFRNIQTALSEIEGKKQNVCLELQRQLDFFASSTDKLEEKYSEQKEKATLQQKGAVEALEQEIDDIALADKLLSEVLPWEHYFDNLESNTSKVHNGSIASLSAKTGQSQLVKPSGEALYLANVKPDEIVDGAIHGNSNAHFLRAYKIDNALLKARAVMLKREADRLEKNIRSDRVISKLLMENDVFRTMVSSKK